METIVIEPWADDLAERVTSFPDFVLHRMATAGVGHVDAEWTGGDAPVVCRYIPRLGGEACELAQRSGQVFRSILACWARRFGVANPYCGHSLFAVEPANHWPHQGIHRFSLFLCNEPTMGIWLRIYLYCVDGIWPVHNLKT